MSPAPDWRATVVAPRGTHHLLRGEPLYAPRFDGVLKFHEPGLAPACDTSGMYHIDTSGNAAYTMRFRRTLGFYEGLAAVEADTGWHHILPTGEAAFAASWAWCGNFQGGRCPVREEDGRYLHIDTGGESVYRARWRYAGDYRDGIAVVQGEDGRSTHVDTFGALIHGRWFLDLDVFHKAFARARDEGGWMHVDAVGTPIYERRFAAVEPFYNGQARVERFDGGLEVVDEQGRTQVTLRAGIDTRIDRTRARKILLVGLPGSGKTTVADLLATQIGAPVHRLDTLRRAVADGTVAGDYLARAAFLRQCRAPGDAIYEFGATGHHRIGVRQAFREVGDLLLTVWVDTPGEVRRQRLALRATSVPLPDWGIAPGAFDDLMEKKLQADFNDGFWEDTDWRALRVDGTRPAAEVADAISGTWASFGGGS